MSYDPSNPWRRKWIDVDLGGADTDRLDESNYLVHIIGDAKSLSVLGNRRLHRGPKGFGAGRNREQVAESHRAVCFSETPLGFLHQLSDKRKSTHGIAFQKRFLIGKGATPVWYLEKGTASQIALDQLMTTATTAGDWENPIWKLTPFIDCPAPEKTFDFRWEREWRVTSDVSFDVDDVAFLLLPEDLHDQARGFFEDAERENIGPAYHRCRYFDPRWDLERVKSHLRDPLR